MLHTNASDPNQRMVDMSAQRTSPDNDLQRNRDEDHENNSENENMQPPSDDEQEPNQQPRMRKVYHRHTKHQLQELESFFKECPHPDDKQRKAIGKLLGLTPQKVKFWFQNKRTQLKTLQERNENAALKIENEQLRAENKMYKEVVSKSTCRSCGGPRVSETSFNEQQLLMENARLKEEIERVSRMAAANNFGNPLSSNPNMSPHSCNPSPSLDQGAGKAGAPSSVLGEMHGGSDLPTSADYNKSTIVELALAAMEELTNMALVEEPIWVPGNHHAEILNEEAYLMNFPSLIGPKPLWFKTEASRECVVVIMNHTNLLQILMDAKQWSTVFCGIVSRATTVEVLTTGEAGNYNGALQVMSAEIQFPSPFVPTRENYFARYCKQLQDDLWGVVDVSIDNREPGTISICRRRPSGCLIQDMPNGYSKVKWVEHVEVDDRAVNILYKPLVNSCLAFGAQRWVASLYRQCERLASTMASNTSAGGLCVVASPEGRKGLLKLAERMIMSFCTGVGASTGHGWAQPTPIGPDDVRVTTRKSMDDRGRPLGIILCAATSLWLPVPPRRVFDFLRDQNSRNQWDILSDGCTVHETARIASGSDPGNCVSLLRINRGNTSKSNMLILQESCIDYTGSYVVYAPVDAAAINGVLNGCDPDDASLLPSGFAVLPDGPGVNEGPILEVGSGGCLLSVAFQILVNSAPTAKLSAGSATNVSKLIMLIVERIKAAVMCDSI